MLTPKTHYEQIPVEAVRKIVDGQMRRETAAEQDQGIENRTIEGNLPGDEITISAEGVLGRIEQGSKCGRSGVGHSRNDKAQQGRHVLVKKFRIVLAD
jgi:hypothetical protein